MPIGVNTALSSLTIANATTSTAVITVPNIGSGLIGTTTGTGVTGAVSIGNTSADSIVMSGNIYKTGGAVTLTTEGGTNAADIEIDFTKEAAVFIATSGDNVSLVGGDVSLANGSHLTIDTNIGDGETNGGNISIAGGIDGTSDENLTLDAHSTGTGTITLANVGQAEHTGLTASEINTLTLTAGGGITLGGDISTSDANDTPGVDINGDVTLSASVTITTDSGGTDGTIDISGDIDGTSGSHQNLTIDSGTANVTIGSGTGTQVIGSTEAKALGKIEINKTDGAGAETGTITIDDIGTATTYGAGTSGTTTDAVYIGNAHTTAAVLKGAEYNFNNSVYIQAKAAGSNDDIQIDGASPTFQATNDTITFETGVINLASGLTTIQSNNGPITLTAVYGQGDEDLTVDAGASDAGGDATVSVGIIGHGTGTSTSEISKVTLDGPDGVTLSGNITTGDYSDAAVDITGPVTLGAGITIDTAETNNDGTITFNSTRNNQWC